jgi:DNA adenine methylase
MSVPSPLNYFGSKSRLAPRIVKHFPPHRTYVESFGGSAAVLLAKEPAKVEVYNDLDRGLVNLFQVRRAMRPRISDKSTVSVVIPWASRSFSL